MSWVEIKDFEGYFINEKTEILTKKRNGIEKKLKQGLSGCGYLNVVLMKDGKRIAKKTHRLMAETFLEKPSGKDHVNHKDGNKKNNFIENLEWCNRSENVRHAIKIGLIKKKTLYAGKLDDCQILTLLTVPKTTKNGTNSSFTNRFFSKQWKISESQISIIRNKNGLWNKFLNE